MWYRKGEVQVEYNTVHVKLAGHGQRILKMSGEELLLNCQMSAKKLQTSCETKIFFIYLIV